MIRSFADTETENVFNGNRTKRADRRCPLEIWPVARRKLTQLNRVRTLDELAVPPGNKLSVLAGDRAGQYSIRINRQYRICFAWEAGNADRGQIIDYH